MFDVIDDGEFTPLTEESAEYIVALAVTLKTMLPDISEPSRTTVELAANNLMRLTSMTMAGFHLFALYKDHADDLFSDLGVALDLLDVSMPKESMILRAKAYFDYENIDTGIESGDD